MKYKKIISGMLAATLVAAGLQGSVMAEAAESVAAVNGSNASNYSIDSSTSAITGYTGSEANVVIPDTVNGIPVEVIGARVFSSNESIKKVTVPSGVVMIEEEAFLNCPNLESVVLPKGVEDIEKLSFFMCQNLESITIRSGLTCIETNAFYGCEDLKEIVLPNTLEDIEDYAFMGCTSLRKVAIPNGVNYLGTGAFKDCTSLKEISIPNTVTDIDEGLLEGTSAKIVCEQGSAAYQYAQKYGIEVTVVDKVENITQETADPTSTPEDDDDTSNGYSIEYVLKGGTLSGVVIDEYDGTYSLRLPKAVRKGYEFLGWYENNTKVTVLKKGTTGDKVFTAKWKKITKPAKPTISSVKNSGTKKMTIKLKKKVSGAKGYEVMYATNKKFTQNVKKTTLTGTSKTIKSLKKGKTYYVKVRAYKLDSANSKVYGSFSKVKKVTIKK